MVEGRGRRAAMRWRADARPLPQQVPLEALAAELTAYAGRLKGKVGERERVAGWGQGAASTDDPANPPFPSTSQLVEVLNDDYDDFNDYGDCADQGAPEEFYCGWLADGGQL